jgi:phosphoadenosine phosphosulfate reductase
LPALNSQKSKAVGRQAADRGTEPPVFDQAGQSVEASDDGFQRSLDRAQTLAARYGHLAGEALLRPMIEQEFAGRIALVCSFGTESAVLLKMVATIDPKTPVLFVDTGKLFGETLRYRDQLTGLLRLENVRTVAADAARVANRDPDGMLFNRDSDACCAVRKVEPLAVALDGFSAWISGRKRYQGGQRAALPTVEAQDGRIKVNPLAGWSWSEVDAVFAESGLPRHPLEAEGFSSVGCMPCTMRTPANGDRRAGRWAGSDRTECGIHLSLKRVS